MGWLEKRRSELLSEVNCDSCKYVDSCKEMYTKRELVEMPEEEYEMLNDPCKWADEIEAGYDRAVDEEIDKSLGK